MSEDLLCERTGCGHPMSVHNMGRAEKRAKKQATMVSDFPSGQRDLHYHSGMTDNDACSDPACDCVMFVSRV